jgi:hypothetical protein
LAADWDALSDIARSTIKLTLLVDLSIRYKDVKPANTLFKTICDAYEKNTCARRLLLEDNFWTARHNPTAPIAKWIAKVKMAASDLKTVKLTPANQQICDCLLRGLDDLWKPIRDHLVYSPNKVSLDNAIGALEAHKVSTTAPIDHSTSNPFFSAATAKTQQGFGCYYCGQKGHHSSKCPNPSLKSKSKAQANAVEARAGATSTATLGNYGSSENNDNDSFDKEIDVVWG